MSSRKLTTAWFLIVAFACLSSSYSQIALAQQPKNRFTVADEIGIAHFGDPYYGEAEELSFSPDGNYVAVDTERGRLDLNRVEDSLRFYRSQDIKIFLEHPDRSQPPSPVWVVNRSDKEGPVIQSWRWLPDSSGVAFLEGGGDFADKRLMLADLRKKTVGALTSEKESVKTFGIRDRRHYVYTVADPLEQKKWQTEIQAPAVVATGHKVSELLLPHDPFTLWSLSRDPKLWANIGDRRFEVLNNGEPIVSVDDLALSPDGHSLVTKLPVHEVPLSWETLYPPPFPSYPYRIRAGSSVNQFVRINLETGAVEALTKAPASNEGGWPVGGNPSWPSDGQAVLLPGTFIKSKDGAPSRPCVAIVDLTSNTQSCVEVVKGYTETGFEEGYRFINGATFVDGDRHRVAVTFSSRENHSIQTAEYRQASDGAWRIVEQISRDSEERRTRLDVTVKQGLNDPPLLIAKTKQAFQVIWDPNPELKNIELGDASLYRWKDKDGREWKGGLYKPGDYKPGRRYPLVIQTHGFNEAEFRASGLFPTAFAARALAASGIIVLQIVANGKAHCPLETPEQGPCVVSLAESGANQLVSDGLVDPTRIGIIGFSATCRHVMEMLTTSSLHLKAASITDGVMADYLQYMLFGDGSAKERFEDRVIGARPFGEGLQQWFKRSPGFNLDKVNTPLMAVGLGRGSLLSMWQPYAGLRYLSKPVDLIMLNTDEHVLTNPAARMASQGGSVDWFRFWLQDYEDPNPAKAEQYARWRELRKLQEENEKKLVAPAN